MAVLGCAGVLFSSSVTPSESADSSSPREEVVIRANREEDAALAARVTEALREEPYVFTDHVTVTVENGVVRVEGIAFGVQDLHSVLRLVRRIAGKRRVINELELVLADDNGQG